MPLAAPRVWPTPDSAPGVFGGTSLEYCYECQRPQIQTRHPTRKRRVGWASAKRRAHLGDLFVNDGGHAASPLSSPYGCLLMPAAVRGPCRGTPGKKKGFCRVNQSAVIFARPVLIAGTRHETCFSEHPDVGAGAADFVVHRPYCRLRAVVRAYFAQNRLDVNLHGGFGNAD